MSEKRRFPVEEKFMNKKVSDTLYGYLQSVSTMDGDKNRIVYKSKFSPSVVQEYFGIDELTGKYRFQRIAVTRAMRVLIQYGYVRESKIVGLQGNLVNVYELPYDEKQIFQYIPLETLKYLLDACNPHVIKLYVYFLNGYHNFGDEFEFTDKRLLNDCFGVKSNTNKRTNETLKNRLDILKRLGLIDWCEYVKIYNGTKIKTKRLLFVNKYVMPLTNNVK